MAQMPRGRLAWCHGAPGIGLSRLRCRRLLPSVVSFTSQGVLVGEAAKRQLVRRPEATVYSVKRFMGRGYEDVKMAGVRRFRERAAELTARLGLVASR